MSNQEFLKELHYLIKKYNNYQNGEDSITLNKIEKLIKEFLIENPTNIDAHFKLASIYFFLEDYDAIEELKLILNLNKNNFTALIVLAYMQFYFYTEITEDIFIKLSEFHTDNNDEKSMIEFMKSLYYDLKKDQKKQEESLIKSIFFCDKFVWNFIDLGRFYLYKGRTEEGKSFIMQGLKNVKKIYHLGDFSDITDISPFISEFIKGTELPEGVFLSIQESIK